MCWFLVAPAAPIVGCVRFDVVLISYNVRLEVFLCTDVIMRWLLLDLKLIKLNKYNRGVLQSLQCGWVLVTMEIV